MSPSRSGKRTLWELWVGFDISSIHQGGSQMQISLTVLCKTRFIVHRMHWHIQNAFRLHFSSTLQLCFPLRLNKINSWRTKMNKVKQNHPTQMWKKKKKKYRAEQQDLRCELAGQICNNTWQTHPAEGTADSLWSSGKAKSLSAQSERRGAVCRAHSTQTDTTTWGTNTHTSTDRKQHLERYLFFYMQLLILSPSTKKSCSSKNLNFVINHSPKPFTGFTLPLFIYQTLFYPKVWGTSQAGFAMFLRCFKWCSRYSFAIKA